MERGFESESGFFILLKANLNPNPELSKTIRIPNPDSQHCNKYTEPLE